MFIKQHLAQKITHLLESIAHMSNMHWPGLHRSTLQMIAWHASYNLTAPANPKSCILFAP